MLWNGGEIGWFEFWFWYMRLGQAVAMRRVDMTKAIAIGFSGGPEGQSEANKDIREAFPDHG